MPRATSIPRDTGFSVLICGLLAVPLRLLGGGAGWRVHPVAVLVMIAVLIELHRATRARWGFPDRLCATAAMILLAAPATGFAVLALVPLAIMAARRGRHGVIAAPMLVGLALWALQDGPLGQALAGPLIVVEVRLLQLVLAALDLPTLCDGATLTLADGRSLIILRGCSLECLILPVTLGALAARRLALSAEIWPRPAAILLPLALAAALNMARLLAMCFSEQNYIALHSSLGLNVLEVAMTLPIWAALLPQVRRSAALAPGMHWFDGLRPLATSAAVVALCCGLARQVMVVPETHDPLGQRGFVPVRNVTLETSGALTMQVWRNAAGCSVYAANFEMPDATLPLMRKSLKKGLEFNWSWWLGTQQMPAMSPLAVNAWRITTKLLRGRAPKSLITVDPGRCIRA